MKVWYSGEGFFSSFLAFIRVLYIAQVLPIISPIKLIYSQVAFLHEVLCTDIFHKRLYSFYLHDWLWISPRMNLISNQLGFTLHVLAPQLLDYTINQLHNSSKHHHQNVNKVNETQSLSVKIVFLIISFRIMLCMKYNYVCTVMMDCSCIQPSDVSVFISWVTKQPK